MILYGIFWGKYKINDTITVKMYLFVLELYTQ